MRENRGFVSFSGNATRRRSPFVMRLALVLSILAFIIISFIALTVFSSNRLMNISKNEVTNVPSNILPSYSTTSFQSADGQTSLQGWFFKTKNPISTIIVVHDAGSNRLPFGVEMIDMIESWLDNGYNVFLFDQRNSGTSGGDICTYGYLEWQDVLGAIAIVRQISVTTDVILFGIGTGCTSSLMAYANLPPEGANENTLVQYSQEIRNLGFDKSYVIGMILDSPAKESDDYIKPEVVQSEPLGFITKYSVPYAIRVSSGGTNFSLAAEIARLPIPVLILYGGHDTFVGADKIDQIISERNRLNSTITRSVMVSGAGYLEEYSINKNLYIDTVNNFLNSFYMLEEN
ncbi:MAG: lysophospholipase [Saccharofermentans sp.]|nr:lysophospholipase [Saccharofermentans sp.]